MLCLCENVAFVGPVMSPKSNGIVTQLVRFGNDAASLLLTYTDRQELTQRRAHTLSSSLQNKHPFAPLHMHALSPSLIVPVHLSLLYFFHFASLYTIFLSISYVLLSLPPSLPLSEQPSDGPVPFHNSWSCSYGSGSHVGCESVRLKDSLSLHRLSQEGYCSSYCAQVPYNTKSTRSITPGSYSTCRFSVFL